MCFQESFACWVTIIDYFEVQIQILSRVRSCLAVWAWRGGRGDRGCYRQSRKRLRLQPLPYCPVIYCHIVIIINRDHAICLKIISNEESGVYKKADHNWSHFQVLNDETNPVRRILPEKRRRGSNEQKASVKTNASHRLGQSKLFLHCFHDVILKLPKMQTFEKFSRTLRSCRSLLFGLSF